PDNRRPVDYARRAATLDDAELPALLAGWRDGRLKQYLIRTTLTLRREQPDLFAHGSYQALTMEGTHSDRIVAFARTLGEAACVVVVPRLVQPLLDSSDSLLPRDWGDTRLVLPEALQERPLRDRFGGRYWQEAGMALGQILETFPVALYTVPD
ncbi:MAG: hypothetical protein R3202_04150, partial [Candidatus Competibacterales bacterium]|nr:hypothetical protein [Candidatus Competibacterales bacterium]